MITRVIRGRFDITPNGFHGMFYYGGERIFIEPENVFVKEQAVLKSSKEKRVFNSRKNEYKSYAGVDNRLVTQLAHKFHPPKKNRIWHRCIAKFTNQ